VWDCEFRDLLQAWWAQMWWSGPAVPAGLLKVYLGTKLYRVLRPRFDDSDVIQELAMQRPGKEASFEYLRRSGPFRSMQLLAGRRLYEMARKHFDGGKRDPLREQHFEDDASRVFGLAEMLADSMLSPSKYL